MPDPQTAQTTPAPTPPLTIVSAAPLSDDLKIVQAHIDKGQDVPHPLVQRLLSWLPVAGGVAGGIVGGVGGTVGGMVVGGVPGAIGGAAVGGAAGEAVKELGDRLAGNPAPATPGQAATDIATQGAIQGGAEAVGGAVGAVGRAVAPRLMQSALKPSVAALMDRTGNMPTVVKTMLDNGVNVTQNGVKRLYELLGTKAGQVQALVDAAPGTILPQDAVKPVYDVLNARASQANPVEDLKTITSAANEFLANHQPMTVSTAQAVKQGTYKYLGDKAYTGELTGAATEAQKAIAAGLKTEIEKHVPDVASLNADQGKLLEAIDETAKRAGLSGNKDLGGIYWVAQHPAAFLAAQFDRSPAVKSLVANGLYSRAAIIAHTSAALLRVAVQAIASQSGGSQ